MFGIIRLVYARVLFEFGFIAVQSSSRSKLGGQSVRFDIRGQPCSHQRDDLNAFASERSPRPFVLFCAIRKMDAVSLSDLVGMQLFSSEIFGAFLLPLVGIP